MNEKFIPESHVFSECKSYSRIDFQLNDFNVNAMLFV